MVRRALGASLIGTVLALPACFSLDGHDGPVEHRTYVDDWRDEVIYQVLTDRFANGDTSNDWGVRPADPARYHGGDWKGLEEGARGIDTRKNAGLRDGKECFWGSSANG